MYFLNGRAFKQGGGGVKGRSLRRKDYLTHPTSILNTPLLTPPPNFDDKKVAALESFKYCLWEDRTNLTTVKGRKWTKITILNKPLLPSLPIWKVPPPTRYPGGTLTDVSTVSPKIIIFIYYLRNLTKDSILTKKGRKEDLEKYYQPNLIWFSNL